MAVSISRAFARIKADVRGALPDDAIERACEQVGHRWRERLLGPVATVHLFVLQVLCFNTAICHLTSASSVEPRHLAGFPVNAAAYCRARMRLPLAALQALLRDTSWTLRQVAHDGAADVCRWCGLRALLVDGSSTIAPDTPSSQKAFGQPSNQKPGCGFPVPKVLGLFDAFTGMVVEMLCLPLFTHEQSAVWRLHPLLGPGDVLVGLRRAQSSRDRGFCSFVHLAMLHLRGVAGLFRVHQTSASSVEPRQLVDFRPHRKQRAKGKRGRGQRGRPSSRFVRRLGKHDQVVAWQRPASKPKWMTAEQWKSMPAELEVREMRYHLGGRGRRTRIVIIATTLLDPVRYPRDEVAKLYGVRWQVETHFLELKTLLKMRRVKCQTADGVRKELAVYCLVYGSTELAEVNLVRAVMVRAAARQRTTPDRISFIDTVRWLLSAEPGEDLPDLVINPKREDRHEPRVVKDLQDTYRKMTLPRSQMRRRLDLAKR